MASCHSNLSLVFWWQGKQWIKALGTADEKEAERIKQDAESQLGRIRRGKSPIAKAIIDAKTRGAKVEPVLDKSNRTDKYSGATFLKNQGCDVLIDANGARISVRGFALYCVEGARILPCPRLSLDLRNKEATPNDKNAKQSMTADRWR